ncbi:MAG: adenylate/guanylate cyclase domain-containing protein [Candidatus Bipolaricaulota bacterium]
MTEENKRTILFSDIRDFTSLTAQRGDEEAYRLVKTFVRLIEEQVKKQEGKVIKTYGDGVMATLPTTHGGVNASIKTQRALSEHNEANPKDTISAGIGLNWGGVIQEDKDIFGHAVNLTARLANYAKGGQITVSSAFREEENSDNYDYVDLGIRNLKGIGKERIYELLWRGEVARLTTKNNELVLALTQNHLAIELSKNLQKELMKARDELRQEAKNESGFAKFILEKVEGYMDKYLSKIVGRLLTKKGIGLEHPVSNVRLEFNDEELILFIKGEKALTLTQEEIDLSTTEKFVRKFNSVKSSSTGSGGRKD